MKWPKEPGPLVVVRWVDPMDLGGGWKTAKALGKHKPAKAVTVGWVIHEDDDYLVLIGSLCGHHVGTGMTIPVGCIVSRERL